MQRNEYVIIGIAVSEEQAGDLNDWAEELHEVGNIILLSDGMNNDYHIFGKLIALGDEDTGLEWQHFDLILLSQYIREVATEIDNTHLFFKAAQHLDIKLHLLTHFH